MNAKPEHFTCVDRGCHLRAAAPGSVLLREHEPFLDFVQPGSGTYCIFLDPGRTGDAIRADEAAGGAGGQSAIHDNEAGHKIDFRADIAYGCTKYAGVAPGNIVIA